MQRVILKSHKRVITSQDLAEYNETRKSEKRKRRKGTGNLVKAFILLLCFALMALALVQTANAQQTADRLSAAPSHFEPGGVQGDHQTSQAARPAEWYGLVASLSGALVMWLSVLLLERREA